jgi:hypothetical protein
LLKNNSRALVACTLLAGLYACSQGSSAIPIGTTASTALSKSSDKTVVLVTNAGSGDAQIISYRTGQVLATLTGLSNYAIFGGTLIAPSTKGINVYAYPNGEEPKRVIPGTSQAIGIAVSSAVTE